MEVPGNEIWTFDGKDFKGCPFKQTTELTREILKAVNFYDWHGHFPNEGTWMDQSALFIEAVELVASQRQGT